MRLRRRGRRATQRKQMRGGGIVEPERSRQGLKHFPRRPVVAALLQPHVITGADAGQHRELLATKARRSTTITNPEADVLGPESFAPRPQELGQLTGTIHDRAA